MDISDIFIGVLSNLPDCITDFSSDSAGLHYFFYAAKEKYPRILKSLKFDKRDAVPFCEAIDNVIDSFILQGVLWYAGLRMDRFEMHRDIIREAYLQIDDGLTAEERCVIKELSILFKEKRG